MFVTDVHIGVGNAGVVTSDNDQSVVDGLTNIRRTDNYSRLDRDRATESV